MSKLFDFVKNGNNEALNAHLKEQPESAKQKNEQGLSLLQFAAYCRNTAAISSISARLSDFDLFEAVSVGALEEVKKQLSIVPDRANAYSVDGFTPLGLASFFGHKEIASYLLKIGANPNQQANNAIGVAPIHSACATGNYDLAKLLIDAGAEVNVKQMRGVTPLHSAAHLGKVALVKLLLAAGARPAAEMEDGSTPYDLAKADGFSEVMDLLKRPA